MLNSLSFKSAFLGCIILFTVSACGDEDQKKPVKEGLDAEILNLIDSTVHFSSRVSPLGEIKGVSPEISKEITTDSNGIFVEPANIPEGYYHFEYDHNKVLYFVQSGKRLSFDFDASKPAEKPEFSGKLKYESRYLYDKYASIANFEANQNNYFALGEEQFSEVISLLRGKLDTSLVMYIANHPTGSPIFMHQEMLSNLYYSASYLEQYEAKHKAITKSEDFTVSDDYYTKLNAINLNDTAAIANHDFYDFITSYVDNRTESLNNQSSAHQRMHFIDSTFQNTNYQDYLYFNTAKSVAKWESSQQRTELLDTLIMSVSDSDIKRFLTKNISADTLQLPSVENIILEDQ